MAEDNAPSASGRARPGDTVWVLVNHIKPGKQEQHRQWVTDVLVPAVQRVAPDIYRTVRFLEAHQEAEQEQDGSQSVYIMDPVVEGADYRYEPLLTQAYGAEQAAEYLKQIEEWEARPQTTYILKQSVW